ncbi:MAG: L,D-transpeptidase [Thermomicrobiales bacterium]|nr:L,D-transpeptidase [Thermomicrobiales bacterium]
MTRLGRLRLATVLAVAAMLVAVLLPLGAAAATQQGSSAVSSGNAPAPWSPPRTVYIPETGQSIDGVFLDFWRANNGIANYGYPITPEIMQNGHIVQYYQYARFEYWPEDPNGNVVKLGAIGQELRPKTVLRSPFAGVGVSAPKSSVNRDMTAFAQAWMPLDESLASKPNTATWRYVAETGHSVQHGFKSWWEASGEAAYLGNPLTEEYQLKGVTYQIFERGQLAWSQGKDPWSVPLGPALAQKYGVSTAPVAQGDLPVYSEDLFVKPGPKAGNGGERWIEVSIGSQYLWAWEGDVVVLETYVSTGRPGFDTPNGTFYVNTKLESQTMEGVLGGEYYNVPDVPWVMYFTDVGHAIHGAYWHNNFGAVMSHGCINLPLDVAEWMYGWAPLGMRVEIHE